VDLAFTLLAAKASTIGLLFNFVRFYAKEPIENLVNAVGANSRPPFDKKVKKVKYKQYNNLPLFCRIIISVVEHD